VVRRMTAAGLLVALACTPITPEPTGSATASPAPVPASTPEGGLATVYYLLEFGGRTYVSPETHTIVPAGDPGAAVREAIAGEPADPDLFTAFPATVHVRGVTVTDGVATVDWDSDVLAAHIGAGRETPAIQQIVWTLLSLPGVDEAAFTVEGETEGTASNGRSIDDWWGNASFGDLPLTRKEDALEPITIDEPAEGSRLAGTITVSGTASVFEATVGIRLRSPSGAIARRTFTTAGIGAPDRGDWSIELRLPPVDAPETWMLEAFEQSQKDGSDFFVQTKTIVILA